MGWDASTTWNRVSWASSPARCTSVLPRLRLIAVHQSLEALVLPRDLLEFKRTVEQRYAVLVYDGLWFTPLKAALDRFIESTQERVTGEVALKLFKGSVRVVGRAAPQALYQHALATYSAGDQFRQEMAEGFIYVSGLPTRTWAATEAKPAAPDSRLERLPTAR